MAFATGCSLAAPSHDATPPQASQEPFPTTGLAEPGRPYGPDEILAAMRESRRPGGVPDDLETPEIAALIADEVWTFDGEPWAALAIGGSCGGSSCSLDVGGTTDGGGSDLYTFTVDLPGPGVTVLGTDLHGHPAEIEPDLDAMGRAAAPAGTLDDLVLASVQWLPPPDTGQFLLAYRQPEEQACGIDLWLGARAGEIIRHRALGC